MPVSGASYTHDATTLRCCSVVIVVMAVIEAMAAQYRAVWLCTVAIQSTPEVSICTFFT